MKRKMLAGFFLAIMVLSLFAQASNMQEERAVGVVPTLSFNGTTAVFEISISHNNKRICATMELWQGKELLDSWSGEDNSNLYLSGTYAASKGKTYTLKAYGTIGGEPFTAKNITKVC